MANSRQRLAKYLNKTQYYKAVFGYLGHNKNNKPTAILFDVFPVTAQGCKIALRSKPKLVNKHGQQIACQHLWTSFTSAFCQNKELLYGDIIMFKAIAVSYPITRQDTINKREAIWQNGIKKADQVYQNYQNQLPELDTLYHSMRQAQEKAYQSYKANLLTFDEMRAEQKRLLRVFKQTKRKLYRSMQAKQKRRLLRAQDKISQTDLIDYTLDHISNLQVIKQQAKYNSVRIDYNLARLDDLKYTKYLSARSIFAKENKLQQLAEMS